MISSVGLLDWSAAHALARAQLLVGDFAAGFLVGAWLRLDLLPHLLHGARPFVQFTCVKKNQLSELIDLLLLYTQNILYYYTKCGYHEKVCNENRFANLSLPLS